MTRRVLTTIRDAGSKGRGVFATAPIVASSRVATFEGNGRWIWNIPREDWPYSFQVGYDRYVVPQRRGVAWFINHSCEPNCVISGRSLVAARRIGKGEELTFDYSTDVDWPGFRMACSCGTSSCRRVVTAYRFLPRSVKQRYDGHVALYIARRYPKSTTRRQPQSEASQEHNKAQRTL